MVMKIKNPRFALPATVRQVNRSSLPEKSELFPFGTVHIHIPTGIVFMFIKCGGRWDSSHAILTANGAFVRWVTKTTVGDKQKYTDHYGVETYANIGKKSWVQFEDKRSLWNVFDKWLQTQPSVQPS